MEEQYYDIAYASLDEIQALLERMLAMARRAGEADCSLAERETLQKQLWAMQDRIDRTADVYKDAAVAAVLEQFTRAMELMETREERPYRLDIRL